MATMKEDLQQAASELQKQIRDGLRPDVGSMVLLYHRDGLAAASNLTPESMAQALRALLEKLERGHAGDIVAPGRGIVGVVR